MAQQTLHYLKQGQSGKVIRINGGRGIVNKLDAIGIRRGKEITILSNSFIGGPVTVKVNNAKIAIGHGMAARIMVEI